MADKPLVVDGLFHRRLMGSWVTGVSLVTANADDGKPVGCTLNALTSLSLEPPSLIVSLGEESRTLAAIRSAGRFCINVLASDQEHVARRFADSDLTAGERFERVEFETRHDVPVITGCVVNLVCDLTDAIPIHDHVIVIGEVVLGSIDDELVPLVFFGGSYEVPRSAITP